MSTVNYSDAPEARPGLSRATKDRISERLGERALFDEPLSSYVAYRVGGPADALVFPKNESELDWIVSMSREHDFPMTVIGTGTNLLVRDEGIRGVTVSLLKAFQEIEPRGERSGEALVRVGGGVEKPRLLDWAVEHGLKGLEFSSGVPGTIGGGLFMNAGTKYGCYGDILREVRLYDFLSGPKQFRTDPSQFSYRSQDLVSRTTLVCWAEFGLDPSGKTQELRAEVDRIIAERAEKQPLDFPSCGSTFKNPPGYSAGRLIEKAGLKGRRVGNAEISLKHANFILNKGGAKAGDILELIRIIQEEVRAQFSVELEPEVIVLGGGSAQV